MFGKLPTAQLERLLAEAQLLQLPAGTVLFDASQPCRGFPLLLEGSVRVAKSTPTGREILLYRVDPGQGCILSGGCLLGHSDYTARGIAERDVTLLSVPPALFQELLLQFEPFRRFVFGMYGERLAEMMELVEEVAFRRLDERLAQLLVHRGPVIEATHQRLADELGSVREIVSRLLRSFEERGWVKLERERHNDVDPKSLAAHGISEKHYLTPLFEPSSVAIIGASERAGSIGAVLVGNMLAAQYQGTLYAVNPKYKSVQGVPCFDAIGRVPPRVDLAVVATPPHTVPEVIEQCGRAGVRAAVVITAGFSEAGPAGAKLERAVLENARRHRLRVVGPNCLGLMRPTLGLNATFARGTPYAGSLGLISQSGAICTAMLDWARPNKVGFSSVVSLGGSTDVDFGEIIDYLVEDAKTEHILLYIEGVRNARRFVSALRAAARVKPVILMKVGRHPAGSRAAVSHTGAIVGLDDVFEAVVKRAGVVRVSTIGQLVAAAQALPRTCARRATGSPW